MITICFTYFRSLGLANLRAALYSVRQQDLSQVEGLVVVDNNTDDSRVDIQDIITELAFPIQVALLCCKHGDPTKTHSWSMNTAIRKSRTPWVFCTRADYLLDPTLLRRSIDALSSPDANSFVTANGYHLNAGILECESATDWRQTGARVLAELPGALVDYTKIDTGVWLCRRSAFNAIGGFDETLTAWGHAQTFFQFRLADSGVEFIQIPETLFFHPRHAAERDILLAHAQLQDRGFSPQELWARHPGEQPYK